WFYLTRGCLRLPRVLTEYSKAAGVVVELRRQTVAPSVSVRGTVAGTESEKGLLARCAIDGQQRRGRRPGLVTPGAANAKSQTLQARNRRSGERPGKQAPFVLLAPIVAAGIRRGVGIGAVAIGNTVEYPEGIGERAAEHLATRLQAEIAVRKERRGQPHFKEAVELFELLALQAHRGLELAGLKREPSLEASADPRIHDHGPAVTKIGHQTKVVDAREGA